MKRYGAWELLTFRFQPAGNRQPWGRSPPEKGQTSGKKKVIVDWEYIISTLKREILGEDERPLGRFQHFWEADEALPYDV